MTGFSTVSTLPKGEGFIDTLRPAHLGWPQSVKEDKLSGLGTEISNPVIPRVVEVAAAAAYKRATAKGGS